MKLFKNAAYSFERILEAVPDKPTMVWPHIFYFTNYPSKINKTRWKLLTIK